VTELTYARSWALDDIVIRSGGDGRTVEAYAAVFDTPAEIIDEHGEYIEVIDRAAFNRAISHGINRVGVYYHHGKTLYGTPSDLGSVPIGRPTEISPDGRGLRTVTRFNKSQLAEAALEAIRNGDITGYSFRGRIIQPKPTGRLARNRDGSLRTVVRTELGLTEYGPTPTPAYSGAGILAVRSAQTLAADLASLADEQRDELIRLLSATPDVDPAEVTATPEPGPGAEDPPRQRHSGRLAIVRARQRMDATRLGVRSGKATEVLGDRRGDGGTAR
jgi:HK97 family phage prohead protease